MSEPPRPELSYLKNSWEKIRASPHHGFCVPLFSIHTHSSCGSGEIFDLIPLIDWMSEMGYDTLQLLPINDTGLDNSPYNAISTCAIHPIYLSLEKLPGLEKYPTLHEKMSSLKALTKTKVVEYKEVREKKEAWITDYLLLAGPDIQKDPAYLSYIEQNAWLESYACFKALAGMNQWRFWKNWTLSEPDRSLLNRETLIQFLLFQQLKAVKQHACQKNVLLMGDIPILVSSQSADVWSNPSLFDLANTVGAPPDIFSEEGQSWGFPSLKWQEKPNECFLLWRRRLKYAENFYHLFRLDHIVGFFRLWIIPQEKKAKEGSFVPSLLSEALERGHTILEKISSYTSMLPIGEDLGVVPPEFKEVMKSLGILGTRVVRWERRWDSTGEPIPYPQYEPLSLSCISTHDTEPLSSWWDRHPEESSLFALYHGVPYRPLDTELRKILLKGAHSTKSIFHVNLLNEYLALYPELTDEDPHHERINIPGTPPETNWRFRFKKDIETLAAHSPLKATLIDLIH